MADIFISYTSKDRDWAFWIGIELEALGHIPHVHEWEIPAGGNIMAWMDERYRSAEHILCVMSKAYLEEPYSSLERQAAQWAAASQRVGFALPVFVEPCEPSALFAPLKRCDLYGLSEDDARMRLKEFLSPVGKPPGRATFPGIVRIVQRAARKPRHAMFPRVVGTEKESPPPAPPLPDKLATRPFEFRILTLKHGIVLRVLDEDICTQLKELPKDEKGLAGYFVQRPDAVVMPMSRILVSRVQPTRIIRENEALIAAFNKQGEKREPVTVIEHAGEFLILDGNATYLNGIAGGWLNIPCIIDR